MWWFRPILVPSWTMNIYEWKQVITFVFIIQLILHSWQLVMVLVVVELVLLGCQCVLSSNMSSTLLSVQYIPLQDDVCTNECSDSDPHYWCGKHRENPAGRVMRCVQYTMYGEIWVAECGGRKKKYNWCLTNAVNSMRVTGGITASWWVTLLTR